MRIYVAHTYGRSAGKSEVECTLNVLSSIDYGRKLIKMGHNPFIPNLYHFVHANWGSTLTEPEWSELVSEWIQFCDALLVAKDSGSGGVRREIEIAKSLGIPVYYSIEELNER